MKKLKFMFTALYRSFMNNIIKHAQASEVIVQIAPAGDELNILVEDDGIGFNLQTARTKGGLGIKSLESRVQYLDGKLEFNTSSGKGTSIIVTVPNINHKKDST